MDIIDQLTISRFHEDRTCEFGPGSVESLGWLDAKVQQIRFEVLSGIANLDNHIVTDAGCGHADLYPFLQKKYPAVQYTGIELIPAFLDHALKLYGNEPGAKFFLGDFTDAELPPTDYILCSGGLSYRNKDTEFINQIIPKLFAKCKFGLGFNLLSKVKNEAGILVAYDPGRIYNACKQLSDTVVLYDNYLPGDFTVFLYH